MNDRDFPGRNDIYHFTDPAALACLDLLSPRHRVDEAGYQLSQESKFQRLYKAILSLRSTRLRDLMLILAEVFDPPPHPGFYNTICSLAAHLLALHRPSEDKLYQEARMSFPNLLTETGLFPRASFDEVKAVRGCERTHPLLALHLLAAKTQSLGQRQRRVETLTPGYRKYALKCHLAYREVEKYYLDHATDFSPKVQADHLYRCALSLRYFMQSLPFAEEKADWDSIERDIRLALYHWEQQWRGKDADWKRLAEFHGRNIREALKGIWERQQGTSSHGDPGGPHDRQQAEETPEVLPEKVWTESQTPGVWHAHRVQLVTVFAPFPPEARERGECPDDYATDKVEVRSFGLNRHAAGMAALRMAQRLDRDAILFPFASEYLQLHEYARLYENFFAHSLEERSPTEQAIIVLLLLLIHLGGDLDSLLRAELRSNEGAGLVQEYREVSEGPLLVDPSGKAVWRPVPKGHTGYQAVPSLPSDPLSHPVRFDVFLPLLPFLRTPLQVYLVTRRILASHIEGETLCHLFLKAGDPPSPLTRDDIEEHLRAIGVQNPSGLLRRIGRSFFPLYVSRLGLDPHIAAYVSGAVPRLFATQMFYRHVNGDRLIKEYWEKAPQAHRLIWAEMEAGGKGAGPLEMPVGIIPSSPGGGYGSRIVPQPEALRRFVEAVKTRLAQLGASRDEARRIYYHNLFTAYAWVVCHFASGARPLNAEKFNEALAPFHPERMRLAEKQSPRYLEVRTVWRNRFLLVLCKELERARQAAQFLSSFKAEAYAKMGRPLCFFLGWDGKPTPVTPADVRRVLDLVPEIGQAFPFPLNVARHLLETSLGEAEADSDAKDYSLGHQRRWREALGRFSMADLSYLETSFANHTERTLDAFTPEVIRFYTEGWP